LDLHYFNFGLITLLLLAGALQVAGADNGTIKKMLSPTAGSFGRRLAGMFINSGFSSILVNTADEPLL
jgi:hypothetical protein